MILRRRDGGFVELKGVVVPAHLAKGIRDGQVTQVDVYFD